MLPVQSHSKIGLEDANAVVTLKSLLFDDRIDRRLLRRSEWRRFNTFRQLLQQRQTFFFKQKAADTNVSLRHRPLRIAAMLEKSVIVGIELHQHPIRAEHSRRMRIETVFLLELAPREMKRILIAEERGVVIV